MAVIDSSYFVGEISIPNTAGSGAVVTATLAKLNRLISIYEKDYLTKLLGDTLYDEFIAALEVPDDWATDLLAELRDDTLKLSPVAYYVYYFWLRDSVTYVTSNGQAEGNNENAVSSSPALRMSESYNRMVRMTEEVLDYIGDEQATFPSTPETEYTWLRKINTFNI